MKNEDLKKMVEELLDDAQSLFGEMMDDWTFYGIEIKDMPPCLLYYPKTGYVTISLSRKVMDSDIQLTYQLSHEICHLLHPSREREGLTLNNTLIINEGISTYFSILKTGQHFGNEEEIVEELKTHSKNYYFAYTCVRDLLHIDPNAIKTLREKTPRIDKLTEKDFDRLSYIVSSELKKNLLMPFSETSNL